MTEQMPGSMKALPIVYEVPDDLGAQYATNLVIQHSNHEFVLSFFEIIPPVILGSPEERVAQLKDVTAVRARCLARIVVAAGRMQGFVEAMQENLSNYLAQKGENE